MEDEKSAFTSEKNLKFIVWKWVIETSIQQKKKGKQGL